MTPRADRIRRLIALLAVLALAGFAAACGDDEEGSDKADTTTEQTGSEPAITATEPEGETTETTPESSAGAEGEDPESTFLAFQTALADGDADTVCGLLAPSAIKQAEEASIGGKCVTWVKELSGVYDAASKAKVKKTKVDSVKEKGDKATLEYTSPILNLPLEVELEKDGESWKISKLAEGV